MGKAGSARQHHVLEPTKGMVRNKIEQDKFAQPPTVEWVVNQEDNAGDKPSAQEQKREEWRVC